MRFWQRSLPIIVCGCIAIAVGHKVTIIKTVWWSKLDWQKNYHRTVIWQIVSEKSFCWRTTVLHLSIWQIVFQLLTVLLFWQVKLLTDKRSKTTTTTTTNRPQIRLMASWICFLKKHLLVILLFRLSTVLGHNQIRREEKVTANWTTSRKNITASSLIYTGVVNIPGCRCLFLEDGNIS